MGFHSFIVFQTAQCCCLVTWNVGGEVGKIVWERVRRGSLTTLLRFGIRVVPYEGWTGVGNRINTNNDAFGILKVCHPFSINVHYSYLR